MRVAFTPGPWLIHATNRVVVRADEVFDEITVKDGKVTGEGAMPTSICLLRNPDEGFSEDETLANGFLIAAAPELYEALAQHAVHEEFDYPGDAPESCGMWCNICNQHVDDDRIGGHAPTCVLSKARGGE